MQELNEELFLSSVGITYFLLLQLFGFAFPLKISSSGSSFLLMGVFSIYQGVNLRSYLGLKGCDSHLRDLPSSTKVL